MIYFFTLKKERKITIEDLINNYSKPLMKICFFILKDFHLAEEAVQDTLYKAYTKYSTFLDKSSEKTWITRIAINTCNSYMRKSHFKNLNYESSKIPLIYSKSFIEIEDSIDLLNIVFTLQNNYKQVILLYYYFEFSISEISSILNKKANTISVNLKRARELIKQKLVKE